jgi:hypothetical protein
MHVSSARIVTISIAWAVMSTPWTFAQDLSKYREYQLGMSPVAVAQHADIAPETRVIHHRPELIEELTWTAAPLSISSTQAGDSARRMLFSFYNGQLFRIVVYYAWDRTEGMTVEDVVGALSVTYGPATLPATDSGAAVSWGYASSDRIIARWESDRIVARWEDAQHSLNVVRPSLVSTFGLVMFSKPLDALARAASAEAMRLDDVDAPTRAVERQTKQEDDDHARRETARRANRATFRP